MKIKISEIENKETKREKISFSEIYEEFNSDEPITAELEIEIISSIIQIRGKIDANVKLTCDYCLEEFTKKLNIKVNETLERETLKDNYGKEFEITDNKFYQDLNGEDEIDLTDFIYQCIILNIPNRLVCGINCKGSENLQKYLKQDFTDPRLEVFKNIKLEKE